MAEDTRRGLLGGTVIQKTSNFQTEERLLLNLLLKAAAHHTGAQNQDAAALDAVRRAGQFSPAPAELREASYSFRLTISFEK